MTSGPTPAILAATLFGISTPLAKMILGKMPPLWLASLLYLGSGVGLHLVLIFKKESLFASLKSLNFRSRSQLLGAIVAGGIIAPTCLVYGLSLASSFETSLLLNFETVATTLIAWLIFKENIGRHVLLGKLFIVAGSILVATQGAGHFSLPAFLILGACFFWGVDNNLTRDLEELSPSALGCIKGWGAGCFNLVLALLWEPQFLTPGQVAFSMLIGAISYGGSIVLFVQSLRLIGASRTGTFFSTNPFIGMILSILILREHPSPMLWIAGALSLIGILILAREVHSHSHSHEPITHHHLHFHDEHHLHDHDYEVGSEAHDHVHTHQHLVHTHSHYPDIHHRHHD